jgi:hypothetical protein
MKSLKRKGDNAVTVNRMLYTVAGIDSQGKVEAQVPEEGVASVHPGEQQWWLLMVAVELRGEAAFWALGLAWNPQVNLC